jgi:endonuclease/exonuclease/phosphatase (EEP) superfamily protein YafD
MGALLPLDADVYVMPESFRPDEGEGLLDEFARAGYHVDSVAMMRFESAIWPRLRRGWRPSPGTWCLGIASRRPVLARREISMGTTVHDPAGERHALALDLDLDGTVVTVVGLHTSSKLWWAAPAMHLRNLRDRLPAGPAPAVVAGDFNFWGPGVERILPGWKRTVLGPTYPAHRPHSQIDHILVNRAVRCVEADVLGPTGSDHRPVRARLEVVAAENPVRDR